MKETTRCGRQKIAVFRSDPHHGTCPRVGSKAALRSSDGRLLNEGPLWARFHWSQPESESLSRRFDDEEGVAFPLSDKSERFRFSPHPSGVGWLRALPPGWVQAGDSVSGRFACEPLIPTDWLNCYFFGEDDLWSPEKDLFHRIPKQACLGGR